MRLAAYIFGIIMALLILKYRDYLAKDFIDFQNSFFGNHFTEKDVKGNRTAILIAALGGIALMIYGIVIDYIL